MNDHSLAIALKVFSAQSRVYIFYSISFTKCPNFHSSVPRFLPTCDMRDNPQTRRKQHEAKIDLSYLARFLQLCVG